MKWIHVLDEKPKDGQIVDIWHKGKRLTDFRAEKRSDNDGKPDYIWLVSIDNETRRSQWAVDGLCDENDDYYYWMPLPEPPK